MLHIPPSPSITWTSPSNCLVSYTGHSLGGGSYPTAEVQSVYSTAPADWIIRFNKIGLRAIIFAAIIRYSVFILRVNFLAMSRSSNVQFRRISLEVTILLFFCYFACFHCCLLLLTVLISLFCSFLVYFSSPWNYSPYPTSILTSRL